MRKHSRKRFWYTYLRATLLVLFCYALIGKGYVEFERTGENLFHIQVNGQDVGTLADVSAAGELLLNARRSIAEAEDDLVFLEAEWSYTGEEVLWGEVDDEETVQSNMEAVLREAVQEKMHRSYTVKVDEYTVNLRSAQEVVQLLQAAVNKYDTEGKFQVELVHDGGREFNVLTTRVNNVQTREEEEEARDSAPFLKGGIQTVFARTAEASLPQAQMDFEDYELGLLSIDFSEKVEVVEAYLPESQLKPVEQAIEEVTKEQELKTIYTVVAGDTLSEIAMKVNIPMEEIVAMNESLESVNSILHIGDELVITVPEPELSVNWQVEDYIEETYDADVVYIDNDTWYTTETKVHQQPSAGFRKIIAISNYVNDKEVGREIVKEEVLMEAVPLIVERGTKVPPTYIKPINGGRLSSPFGQRSRPTKGASTYHKGVDWATPTGTSVYASNAGKVSRAGWGSGYGYVVYIDHEDGRQTRYGHLSKILVKVGQTVKQGEKIALSGNTGVTTGPHVHFEILINGKQVDPLKYLN